MSYEEQVFNGVLCYRLHKSADWLQYSVEQLTTKLLEARMALTNRTEHPAPVYINPQPVQPIWWYGNPQVVTAAPTGPVPVSRPPTYTTSGVEIEQAWGNPGVKNLFRPEAPPGAEFK